jgi:DNA-binding PadR family transcriptional regulator
MKTRLELLLLAALAPGPRPAYRLAEEARRRGAVPSSDAPFETLQRLERDGLVASGRSARRRRVYRLTARGRARLEAERSAWAALARTVAAAYAA